MSVTNGMFRLIVAMICVLATINALAVSSNLQGEMPSSVYASRAASQSMTLANGQFTGAPRPTAVQLQTLANALDNYLDAAEKDGTLALSEKIILKNSALLRTPNHRAAMAAYGSLKANGWLGSQVQIETTLDGFTDEQREVLIGQIQAVGLKAVLRQGVDALQQ